MKILNLGCETKTNPEMINIDWSIYLRIRLNKFYYFLAPVFIRGERLKKLRELPRDILLHDLSKGIPFPSNSIDVVYHSHFLEHLDRDIVEKFLLEVKRVLRSGGIQRIVVPDLEKLTINYITHLQACNTESNIEKEHDHYISAIIWPCVLKEAFSTSQQPKVRRFIENLILGDARERGITHQWMYDRISLSFFLRKVGFKGIKIEQYNSSSIPDWNKYGLDLDDFGNEYKPGSLYVEAKK